MGELGALFNPGMRHELEERRARAARREEEGNARDGDLRIDLDSGVAVINAPDDDDSERAVPADRPTDAPTAAQGPAAEPDDARSPAEDGTIGTDEESGRTAPAPLRPRGKRAVAAATR
jgi:hypothetical protein